MFTHRPVMDSDLDVIVTFPQSVRELFNIFPAATYPLTVEQLKKAVAARQDSTVILQDCEIVGFANFYAVKSGVSCGIGNLIVNPTRRGQGVGEFLTRTMIEKAFNDHAVPTVFVSCFADNFAGLLLYTKIGFTPFAVDSVKTPDGNIIPRIQFRLERTART